MRTQAHWLMGDKQLVELIRLLLNPHRRRGRGDVMKRAAVEAQTMENRWRFCFTFSHCFIFTKSVSVYTQTTFTPHTLQVKLKMCVKTRGDESVRPDNVQ